MIQLESEIFDFAPITNKATEVFDFDPLTFTKVAILPELDARNRELVLKLNTILGTKHDGVSLSACLNSPEWRQMKETFTIRERINTTRVFNSLHRNGVTTLGEARKLVYNEMMGFRDAGPKSAAILLHAIQPREDLLNS